MLPLVAVATSVIPELIKLIAGDKAGSVANDVAKAVSTVTGTSDPIAAQRKLNEDPATEAALRVKLAEIALEASRTQNEEEVQKRKDEMQAQDQRRKSDLAELQARIDDEANRRKSQLDALQAQLRADIENTANARSFQLDLAKSGSPMQWAPSIISVIVIVFFAAILGLLIAWPAEQGKPNELINIAVGALVAAFSTVISYWLGSSQGSRDKDITNRALQASQTALTTRQLDAADRRTKEIIEVSRNPPPPSASTLPAPSERKVQVDNFDACLRLVLGAEGGYVDDPDDSGGATKFGITLATLQTWRHRQGLTEPVTAQTVQALTRDEACEIYRTNYWNVLRCSELPRGVDLVVFDFGVNAGTGRSAQTLQKVVGVEQDGSIGPITLHAVSGLDPVKIIHEFSARRLALYATFPGFAEFGKGWTNRTIAMEQAALRMAEAPAAQAA
jgi:lysozyme family protein